MRTKGGSHFPTGKGWQSAADEALRSQFVK